LAHSIGVYISIAFTKLFGMRGFTTIFGDFTNIASAKIQLQEDLRQQHR
jgi:hypothetical protein